MGKKKDVDVVMELCQMFLLGRSQESEYRSQEHHS